MKNMRKNIALIVIIFGFVLYFSVKGDFSEILNKLAGVNLYWLLIACLLMFMFLFFRAIEMYNIIRLTEEDYPFRKAFAVVMLGQFFANVTPSSVGAQPFQIYFLNKDKIKGAQATRAIVQYNMVYQMGFLIIGLVSMVLLYKYPSFHFLKLAIFGFILHSIVLIVLLGASFFKKTNKFLVTKIIKTLKKLKILKKDEDVLKKWFKYIEDFHEGSSLLFKNKLFLLRSVIINVIAIICFYLVPLLLIFSITKAVNITPIDSVLASSYTNIIGSFMPSPGGAGGFEYFFTQFFGVFVTGATLTSVMLLWRFITYYLVLIAGFIILLFRKEGDVIK